MKRFIASGFAAVMIAGVLSGQTVGTPAPPADGVARPHRADAPGAPGQGPRMGMRELNLTEEQRATHKKIFDAERQAVQPIEEQLRKLRDTMNQAAKSGASEANIDLLASQAAPLLGQLEALHAKSAGKFYASLTADQKLKFDAMTAQHQGPRPGGPGGPAAHRGPPPAPPAQ